MIAAAEKARFQEQGYVVLRQVAPRELLDEVALMLVQAFRKFNPSAGAFASPVLDDPWFHAAMMQFRAEQPRAFGLMFDTVQTSVALWRFGTHPSIVQMAGALMDEAASGLSVTDMLLRMDAPRDTRNKLAWHQDSTYFRQNTDGHNGCVCSIALRAVTPDDGPLEILPGSHKRGRIDVTDTGAASAIASRQYRVPDDITKEFEPVSLTLEAGDAIFLNFDLIHRSGTNVSESFRFTAIGRFHRMLTHDFVPGRLVYAPSKILVES